MILSDRTILRAATVLLIAPAGPLVAQGRLAPPVADSGLIGYDDEGLRIHSPDGRQQLRIRFYVAAEARLLLSDTADAFTNSIAVRRSRVFFDANVNPWLAFRVMFDVAAPSGPTPIADAFADVGFPGGIWLRAGKQKTPVTLERYTGISSQLLPERSVFSNLTASRDEGLLLTAPLGEHAEASVGAFNGAPDGGTTQDVDANDAKDFTYRLWLKPIRHRVNGVEQGAGIAFSGSTGLEHYSASGGSQLPTFKTPTQLLWFAYDTAGGTRARGRHTRSSAYGYVHQGPWGATAEWMHSSQEVVRGTSTTTVPFDGWFVSTQWSLTGEASATDGIALPAPFDPAKGHWGAFQLGARAAQVQVGDAAFQAFADSTVAARRATELGGSLNWFITRNTKFQLAYEHTMFRGGAVRGGDRKTERYIQLRWQTYF